MVEALADRDMGRVFRLVRQYAGASQTRLAIACGMTQGKISDIMRDVQRVAALDVFERIADGLNMPDDARIALGLAPHPPSSSASPAPPSPAPSRPPVIPLQDAGAAMDIFPSSGSFSVDSSGGEEDEDPVRRRTFVGLTGASLFGAVLASAVPGDPADNIESFAALLAGNTPNSQPTGPVAPPDLPELAAAVAKAKRDYQACQYADVASGLPALLTRAQSACAVLTGDARLRAHTLSAEAHHVAASILLKFGDQGLALLAADRSMQAARASEDALTVGSSARIITHAMMRSGHLAAATTTASRHAVRLNRDVPAQDRESLSVYGSLLLRGATAAAQRGDRRTAHELLAEATDASGRLGADSNLRWTAFGPVNVKLHHVNVAVTLGDAGTAIDIARSIDLNQVTVTERKASLLIDTARAFLQCGKHGNAYLTLRAAQELAPEEISRRPAVRQVVQELVTTAPSSIRAQAREFADSLAASR
jgi:transcriptional regulator with XRE-family HTH domain